MTPTKNESRIGMDPAGSLAQPQSEKKGTTPMLQDTTEKTTTPEPVTDTHSNFQVRALCRVEPTIAEVDWAEQNLSHLPTLISFDDERVAENWEGPDGNWYRKAGFIWASPITKNRFRIWLYKGSTVADLEWFEGRIEEAKLGYFTNNLWRAGKSDETKESYYFNYSREVVRTADLNEKRLVVPCDEDRCEDEYHWVHNHGDWFEHSIQVTDAIKIYRDGRDPESAWMVAFDENYECDAAKLAGFISDLQWALTDIKKLNGARSAEVPA